MRDQYLNMRVEAETKRRLDELRRIEKDLPGQTAMVERLIDDAYITRVVHPTENGGPK